MDKVFTISVEKQSKKLSQPERGSVRSKSMSSFPVTSKKITNGSNSLTSSSLSLYLPFLKENGKIISTKESKKRSSVLGLFKKSKGSKETSPRSSMDEEKKESNEKTEVPIKHEVITKPKPREQINYEEQLGEVDLLLNSAEFLSIAWAIFWIFVALVVAVFEIQTVSPAFLVAGKVSAILGRSFVPV